MMCLERKIRGLPLQKCTRMCGSPHFFQAAPCRIETGPGTKKWIDHDQPWYRFAIPSGPKFFHYAEGSGGIVAMLQQKNVHDRLYAGRLRVRAVAAG